MSDPKFENFFELRWPLRTYACTVCVFMRIHAELWLLFFLCYVDPASFVEEVLFSFLRHSLGDLKEEVQLYGLPKA